MIMTVWYHSLIIMYLDDGRDLVSPLSVQRPIREPALQTMANSCWSNRMAGRRAGEIADEM